MSLLNTYTCKGGARRVGDGLEWTRRPRSGGSFFAKATGTNGLVGFADGVCVAGCRAKSIIVPGIAPNPVDEIDATECASISILEDVIDSPAVLRNMRPFRQNEPIVMNGS